MLQSHYSHRGNAIWFYVWTIKKCLSLAGKFQTRVADSCLRRKVWLCVFDRSFQRLLEERARARARKNNRKLWSSDYMKAASVFRMNWLHLCEVRPREMGNSCHMKFYNRIMWKLIVLAAGYTRRQYDVFSL